MTHSSGCIQVTFFLFVCLLVVAMFGNAGAVIDGSNINGKIAFQSNRDGNNEIYVMNADGSGQTRLTNNNYNDIFPSWSTDGSKIAFSSNRDGNNEIYVMNADGTEQTRLTNNNYDDEQPNWWPDDSKIAFCSNRDGNLEIYVMNSDGSGQTRLTNNNYDDDLPRLSPDGTKIAFESTRDGHWETYVMNSDGSSQIRLTNNHGENPSWSPDGTKIACTSSGYSTEDVYVMDSDGSGSTKLTNSGARDYLPCWSPDGSKIVFVSTRDGNNEIYVMNADGSGQTRLTNNIFSDYCPVWQSLYLTHFQQNGVGSDFTGNVLNIDNSAYTAEQVPVSFAWLPGTPHNFSWGSPLEVSVDKRYVWSFTSGLSTDKSGIFIATSGNDSIVANYGTQYYVRLQTSTGGSIIQSSDWYNASSMLAISAIPSTHYEFSNWTVTGSILVADARNQNTTLTINGPGNATANFVYVDLSAPEVSTPSLNSSRNDVQPYQNVKVSANVTDSETGVKNVTLIYSVDNGTTWESPVPMSLNTSNSLYEGIILGQPIDTAVRFKIVAFDNSENSVTKDGTSLDYAYTVVPEFSAILGLCFFIVVTLLSAGLSRKQYSRREFFSGKQGH